MLGREYRAMTSVIGYSESSQGVADVRSTQAGIVSAVHVGQGQWVEQGDRLISLDHRRFNTSGTALNDAQKAFVERELDQIDTVVDIQRHLFEQKKADLVARRAWFADQIESIENELGLGEERLSLQHAEVTARQALYTEGVVTRADLSAERTHHLSLKQHQLRLKRELGMARDQQAELVRELHRSTSQFDVEQADRRLQQIQLQMSLAQLDGQSRSVALAPRAGWIGAMHVSRGDPLDAGSLIASVSGSQEVGRVILLVPSRAMGEMRLGNRVRLRYDGFPYQKFGFGTGSVTAIDSSAKLAQTATGQTEPVFEVEVAVDRAPAAQIVNGMLVRADVVTRIQPVWRWMMQPLFDFVARG